MDRPPPPEDGVASHDREAGRELGQTMAEYAVTLGVITIAILVGFIALSDAAGAQYDRVADLLP